MWDIPTPPGWGQREPQGSLGAERIWVAMVSGMGWFPEAPPPAPPPAMRPFPTALWLGLALALLAVGWASARAPIYVSSWAVRVTNGYQEAERLARKFGFVNLGQVGGTWMDGTWGGDLKDRRSRHMGGGFPRSPQI